MTPILSHLVALFLGFIVATLILWAIHRKQKQDWQAEYRRLMGGIKEAKTALIERRPRSLVVFNLTKLFNGDG